jgi:hypothetical protein
MTVMKSDVGKYNIYLDGKLQTFVIFADEQTRTVSRYKTEIDNGMELLVLNDIGQLIVETFYGAVEIKENEYKKELEKWSSPLLSMIHYNRSDEDKLKEQEVIKVEEEIIGKFIKGELKESDIKTELNPIELLERRNLLEKYGMYGYISNKEVYKAFGLEDNLTEATTTFTNTEKEINDYNYRNPNELMIPCGCGEKVWLNLSCWIEERGYVDPTTNKETIDCEFSIALIDHNRDFWQRLRQGFLYIIGRLDRLYFSDLMINSKDLEKIREFMGDYLMELHIKELDKKVKVKEEE